MGLRDRAVNKAAEGVSKQSAQLFKEIIRIQESMHGYLEKLLEIERLTHNLLREKDGKEPINFAKKDKLQ